MQKNDFDRDLIFTALCEIFFMEESRLSNKVEELEYEARFKLNDKYLQIELIETRANLFYFKKYIKSILDYLLWFDREHL